MSLSGSDILLEAGTPTSSSGRDGGSAALEWYGVQDHRQRKKIQDKLAQRARRMLVQDSIDVAGMS